MLVNYKIMKQTKTNTTISLGIKSKIIRLATHLDKLSK
jgi:hypothetical protein